MAFTSKQREGRNCLVERKMERTKTLKRRKRTRTTQSQPLKKKMKKIVSKENIKKKKKKKSKTAKLGEKCQTVREKGTKTERKLKNVKKELRLILTAQAISSRNHPLLFVELS